MTQEKKIKKTSLVKAFIDFTFFAQSCYNYEKLQGLSFAQCMYHPLKDLYETPQEIGRELEKHTSFFNTETDIGCLIHGMVCAMEEERANTGAADSPITEDSIVAVKTGLMGPLAGVGDSLFQGVLSPLFLSICVGMALEKNLFAPILLIIMTVGVFLSIAYAAWMYGYRMGKNAVDQLLGSNLMQYVLLGAGILGCTAMGGLVATTVKVFTPIKVLLSSASEGTEATYLYVQSSFFDSILLGILPLIATFGVWWLIKKRQWSPIRVICVVAVGGFILGALGILSNTSPV